MDRNGFDTFWMAEHHFQREGYEVIPNILMLAVHLAHLTEAASRFGCGFNIAPMWHPLRLAEDYATADILTSGRVVFGVGRGYHTREVEVVRRADARPGRQPRAVRGAGRDHPQGASTSGRSRTRASTTRSRRACPTAATSSRRSRWCPAAAPAGRVLAADRQRQPARPRLHGQARHQGHHRRRRGGRRRQRAGGRRPGRRRWPATAARPSWAAT